MQDVRKKIVGYGVLALGILMAPLMPFWLLIVVPIVLVWCGLSVSAVLFAVLLDSFLISVGGTPLWISCTFYTVLFLPLRTYIRYTTTL